MIKIILSIIGMILITVSCSSCSINKHGVFVGASSQKLYNKGLIIEQKNDNLEVSYAK